MIQPGNSVSNMVLNPRASTPLINHSFTDTPGYVTDDVTTVCSGPCDVTQ